jgi:hypothetical protein
MGGGGGVVVVLSATSPRRGEEMAMKKVRYLIGAVGVVPTLGIIAPTATAATQPGSATAAAAKLCGYMYHHSVVGAGTFGGYDYFGKPTDRHCLYEARGTIPRRQTGLEMRVRVYQNGGRIDQKYVHGHIDLTQSNTSFYLYNIDLDASSVCEALVYSTSTNRVAYGPLCELVSP